MLANDGQQGETTRETHVNSEMGKCCYSGIFRKILIETTHHQPTRYPSGSKYGHGDISELMFIIDIPVSEHGFIIEQTWQKSGNMENVSC